jgi:hypothetical protein
MPRDEIFNKAQQVLEQWVFFKGPIFSTPYKLPTYTTATIPPASLWEGGVIYISDAASGANIQASNGTAWVNLG